MKFYKTKKLQNNELFSRMKESFIAAAQNGDVETLDSLYKHNFQFLNKILFKDQLNIINLTVFWEAVKFDRVSILEYFSVKKISVFGKILGDLERAVFLTALANGSIGILNYLETQNPFLLQYCLDKEGIEKITRKIILGNAPEFALKYLQKWLPDLHLNLCKTKEITNLMPQSWKCPLTDSIMLDPVICSLDGIIYERGAISKWLLKNKISTSNSKRVKDEKCLDTLLIPNRALSETIENFFQRHKKLIANLVSAFWIFDKGKTANQLFVLEECWKCPITSELMLNPVVCALDGITYEKSAIKEWLLINTSSPLNRKAIARNQCIEDVLIPNTALKETIAIFLKKHPNLLPSLIANIDVGFGNAIYISGISPELGACQVAFRLKCENANTWSFPVSVDLIGTEFNFFIGPYALGETTTTDELFIEPTARLFDGKSFALKDCHFRNFQYSDLIKRL